MTYTTSNLNNENVTAFQTLDIDQQLALFWFIYTEMGESITPAAPGISTASPAIAEALFEQTITVANERKKIKRIQRFSRDIGYPLCPGVSSLLARS